MARLGEIYVLRYTDIFDEDVRDEDMIYEAYTNKAAVVESYCKMREEGCPNANLDIIKVGVFDSADD